MKSKSLHRETVEEGNIQLKSYYQKKLSEVDTPNWKMNHQTRLKGSVDACWRESSPIRELSPASFGRDEGVVAGGGGGGGGGGDGERSVHCALLGDGMVGKTCLTLSYTHHVFTDRYTATVFDNYPVPVSTEEGEFVVNLFDTAGQSDYESLRTSTYAKSEVLVLCFSVCDRESFYSVLNCWLPEIQRHTKGKTPLLLVGTHIDLRETSYPASTSGQFTPSSVSASAFSSSRTLQSSSAPSSSRVLSPPSASASYTSPKILQPSSVSVSPGFLQSSSAPASSGFLSPSSAFSCSPSSSRSSSFSSSSSSSSSTSADYVCREEGEQLARMVGADCYIECSARSQEGVQQVFENVVFSALKYRKKKSGLLSRLLGR